MNILAIETSSSKGSLCLSVKNSTEFHRSWQRKSGKPNSQNPSHSEVANGFIEEMLREALIPISNIDLFVTTVGPGSFTGIRVGLCLAKTFSMTLQKPIKTFDSLFTLAFKASQQDKPIAVIQNAFKNQVFFSTYKWNPSGKSPLIEVSPPRALKYDQLDSVLKVPHLTLGDGFSIYKDHLSSHTESMLLRSNEFTDSPEAQDLVKLCRHYPDLGRECNWEQVQPLYIRASEAEENLRSGQLKPLPKI